MPIPDMQECRICGCTLDEFDEELGVCHTCVVDGRVEEEEGCVPEDDVVRGVKVRQPLSVEQWRESVAKFEARQAELKALRGVRA